MRGSLMRRLVISSLCALFTVMVVSLSVSAENLNLKFKILGIEIVKEVRTHNGTVSIRQNDTGHEFLRVKTEAILTKDGFNLGTKDIDGYNASASDMQLLEFVAYTLDDMSIGGKPVGAIFESGTITSLGIASEKADEVLPISFYFIVPTGYTVTNIVLKYNNSAGEPVIVPWTAPVVSK